ncbi:MAG: hypothetical protein KBD47_00340 [Candidatus Pacebacteria bacterium]|nr:hypothetical protein [Candidatus Paceibacterota bacterium]
MNKISINPSDISKLADAVVEATTRSFTFFFKDAEEIFDLKRISVVELQIFQVFHGTAILKSHMRQDGASEQDQAALVDEVISKFSDNVARMLHRRNPTPDGPDFEYWKPELRERFEYYQAFLDPDPSDATILLDVGYKKIFKPGLSNMFARPALDSKFGKVFMSAMYIVTVYVEDKYKELV